MECSNVVLKQARPVLKLETSALLLCMPENFNFNLKAVIKYLPRRAFDFKVLDSAAGLSL